MGGWVKVFDGADVIINLAGRSVDCRYNAKNRRQIMDSRIDSTRMIGKAIQEVENPPKLWLQSSTATIYAHRFDAANDEETGIIGGGEPGVPEWWDFSIDVAKSWEAECMQAETPQTRKVLLRSAMVMSPDPGGVFTTLVSLVKKGLGGTSGNGKQYVSWIHEKDFVDAMYWIINHEELDGAINISAPNPLPNKAFMQELRVAWGMPIGLPATQWMLEIGAFFLRTETELLLKSRRVVPKRLLDHGFAFSYPEWKEAAAELCDRWRNH